MVADIKSERWPASRRNGWPASVGIRNDRALLRVGRQHFGEGSLEDGERAALREAFARAIAAT